jgi:Tfp pilus assembly protein PilN
MTKYSSEFTPCKPKFQLPGGKIVKCVVGGFMLVLFVATIGGYLYQVNSIATKGFQSRDLEKQIFALQQENEKLQLSLIEMQTMPILMKKIEKLSMVPVDKVTFFDSSNQVFVRR